VPIRIVLHSVLLLYTLYEIIRKQSTWIFEDLGKKVKQCVFYQECFLRIKVVSALGWRSYQLHVPIVLKSGSLKLLEPSGSVQTCKGIALPFIFNTVATSDKNFWLRKEVYIFSMYSRRTRYGQQHTILKMLPWKKSNGFSFVLYCTTCVLTIYIKCTYGLKKVHAIFSILNVVYYIYRF
jgi:hypothetical protein